MLKRKTRCLDVEKIITGQKDPIVWFLVAELPLLKSSHGREHCVTSPNRTDAKEAFHTQCIDILEKN